ncbi:MULTISPECIES: aminoglycoside phosphotransferase family protein [Nocardia]|uniref:aminoglycoside phosphotransferase family protein n=1 Tax=Nocardia TaxID=1817 RepID=UPI0018961C05|nr:MULTISPECIES: aminoglycoside phosphotransferase family protein [Nocardia]MBF6352791.1 kinase [Nocardia flavorosea]
MTLDLPPDVVDTIRTIFEERGERWLAALPAVVARQCREWELEVIGRPFGGGTHSFVAPVRRSDGSVAVLKIAVPDEENAGEATGMFCYQGDGAARLYDYDPGSGALLLEWARPGTPLIAQPRIPLEGRAENADKIQTACALYQRLRRPPTGVPAGYPALPLVADIVSHWEQELFTPDMVHYLPAAVTARARDLRTWLSVPDGPLLIVNRDTHLGNIVAAEREPWLLIDPKAFLGEAAFDAGFLIMKQVETAPDPVLARRAVAATADGLDVDRERARAWAYLRAMEEIAWSLEDERPDDAARYHQVVAALS